VDPSLITSSLLIAEPQLELLQHRELLNLLLPPQEPQEQLQALEQLVQPEPLVVQDLLEPLEPLEVLEVQEPLESQHTSLLTMLTIVPGLNISKLPLVTAMQELDLTHGLVSTLSPLQWQLPKVTSHGNGLARRPSLVASKPL